MSVDESLITFLLTRSAITTLVGTRIAQAKMPQGDNMPYVWINRGTTDDEDDLSANPESDTQFYESFDVECVSEDLDEAQTLAAEIKKLRRYRGTIGAGSGTIFVEDHSDTYQPKNISADDGRHVASADLQIVGYAE